MELTLKEIARKMGWTIYSYNPSGKCRGCHEYVFHLGITTNIWISPKRMYYHKDCAINRIKRETKLG